MQVGIISIRYQQGVKSKKYQTRTVKDFLYAKASKSLNNFTGKASAQVVLSTARSREIFDENTRHAACGVKAMAGERREEAMRAHTTIKPPFLATLLRRREDAT